VDVSRCVVRCVDIELTDFSKYMIVYDSSLNHSIAYPIIHTYYK